MLTGRANKPQLTQAILQDEPQNDETQILNTHLTVFTPQVVQPIEANYLELSNRYTEIRTRLHELVDSVADVVITEEYLDMAAKVQAEVNKLWKEVDAARVQYHKFVDATFYTPIADKIDAEIKSKFSEWENGFKAQKNGIEQQLLQQRIAKTEEWFKGVAPEYITLEHAMNFGGVKITRKNKEKDIYKACNAFIVKVESDMAILNDSYGDEEKTEYLKVFDMSKAVAVVRARREETERVKQQTAQVALPSVEVVIETPTAPIPVNSADILVRLWAVKGTKEQLIKLATYTKSIGVEYEVRGDA